MRSRGDERTVASASRRDAAESVRSVARIRQKNDKQSATTWRLFRRELAVPARKVAEMSGKHEEYPVPCDGTLGLYLDKYVRSRGERTRKGRAAADELSTNQTAMELCCRSS
ncbi:uncharacterized protein LOC113464148 [Ceratina calcarata]|uniref:Uncharacterized protein LOC113464148 n=1 Tax=Ceratina calcarata TaxID=156304 RepID=A0AAJ7RZH1_9HYME|nr:uncharacterized protein LOC113464148 [Ceratina calcarata]